MAKVMEHVPPKEEKPPARPPAPRIDGVTKDTILLGWAPLRQNVSRIVIQALPLKKPTSKGLQGTRPAQHTHTHCTVTHTIASTITLAVTHAITPAHPNNAQMTCAVAWKHFNLKKGVGKQAVISRNASRVNSGIVSGQKKRRAARAMCFNAHFCLLLSLLHTIAARFPYVFLGA